MRTSNTKAILIGIAILAGSGSTVAVWREGRQTIGRKAELLRQRTLELEELVAKQLPSSNQVARQQDASVKEQLAELARLRAEAHVLRQRTNDIAKAKMDHGPSSDSEIPFESKAAVRRRPGSVSVISDADSDEYALQLTRMAAGEANRHSADARNLSWAVRQYARQHQGQMPSDLDDVTPHLYRDKPPPRSGDFEMVFQGSLDELKNIPQQTVVLLRQRQPWPTPHDKLARIYIMADGSQCIVESEDDFQSWEAGHVIPPPPGR